MHHDNNTDEIWRPVPNWPGYEVSSFGHIRSLPRVVIRRRRTGYSAGQPQRLRGGIMRTFDNHKGYRQLRLRRVGKAKTFTVHRLVMLAFVGARPEGMEICHFDGDKWNNRLTNLRYDTPESNREDAKRHGQTKARPNSKLTVEQVLVIRSSPLRTGLLAARFGVTRYTIQSVRSGRTWAWVRAGSALGCA